MSLVACYLHTLTVYFRYNKQHANVYIQDCNLLLKHAIETDNGKKLPPLRSLDDGESLPPLPKPGEVDLICGGKSHKYLRARTITEEV
jgi:hypothetical protein